MGSTQYPGATSLNSVIPFPAQAEARDERTYDNVRRAELAFGLVERLLDFVVVMAAVGSAYWIHSIWRESGHPHYSRDAVLMVAACFALLVVLLLDKHGDYRRCLSLLAVRETERLLRVTIAAFLLALPVLLVLTKPVPRTAVALALVAVPLLLALEKWQVQSAIQMIREWGTISRKAAILGTGPMGRSIFSTLVRSPKFGLDPIAFIDTDNATTEPVIYEASYQKRHAARVLPGPVTPGMLRRLGATVLILAAPEISPETTTEIAAEAETADISTYFIPAPFLDPGYAMEYLELDGMLLALKSQRGKRRWYEAAKRALDVAASAALLLLLAPALAAAWVAIRLTSAGPAIFRQQRVGLNGTLFEMYKFRSMYADSEPYANSPKSGSDPRITSVGQFLRHTCIDELPQLFNVLRGEMSLVGPRPEMPFIVEQYEAIHRRRLAVKPGITGLWQLSADRGAPIHQNISYDLYYARHRTLLMDVAILLHTLVFAFRGV